MKTVLVIGCSLTNHHSLTSVPIPGIRERSGDYTYYLSEIFPQFDWFNFGKGGSSNIEYLRRVTNFVKTVKRPDFVLIQLTFAERALLEFHNYEKIDLETIESSKNNYHVVLEKNLREHAAYISGYNIYCSLLPENQKRTLKDSFALHITSTFHAFRFWETHFLLHSYFKNSNIPHLFFLAHHPTRMMSPPIDHLPLDFSTTIGDGKISLYQWLEKNIAPYESLIIDDEDQHLRMEYNKIVAHEFLAPSLKSHLARL